MYGVTFASLPQCDTEKRRDSCFPGYRRANDWAQHGAPLIQHPQRALRLRLWLHIARRDQQSARHTTLISALEYALESGDHNTITLPAWKQTNAGGGGGRDPDLIFVNFFLHSVAQYFFRRQLLTSLIPFSCDYFQSYCYHWELLHFSPKNGKLSGSSELLYLFD